MTHQGSSSRTDSPTSAVPMSALSAIGSAILPNSVIRPRRRAISVEPVGDDRQHEDRTGPTRPRVVAPRRAGAARRTPGRAAAGPPSPRWHVDELAARRRGRLGPALAHRGHRPAGAGCRSERAATRSMPSVSTTAADHGRPARRPAVTAHGRRTVDLGALVRGCRARRPALRRRQVLGRSGPRRARRSGPRPAGRSAPRRGRRCAARGRRSRRRRACRRTLASVPSSSE